MLVRQMKFVVENVGKIGGRLGHLELPRPSSSSSGETFVYPTPMFFIHTLSGSIPHITHEVFNLIFSNDVCDLIPPVQMSIDTMFAFHHSVGPSGMNISKFVGLPDSPTLLTVLNPAENFDPGKNTVQGISIWTQTGRTQFNTQQFKKIITDFQPTLFQTMSDYDVNTTSTMGKRLKKSTTRTTEEFLSAILLHLDTNSSSQTPSALASLEPAWFKIDELEGGRALTNILENRDKICGFFVKKNYDEQEDFIKLTESFMNKLPTDKLRAVSGIFDLDEIIDLVEQGFDVFDSSLCTKLTNEGKVLILPSLFYNVEGVKSSTTSSSVVNESLPVHDLNSFDNGATSSSSERQDVTQLEILDLSDKRNFDDFRPISLECNCYVCRRHTRSYIHHLKMTNELLGEVLVMAHNLITFDRFFKVLRIALRSPEIVDFDLLKQSVSQKLTEEDQVKESQLGSE